MFDFYKRRIINEVANSNPFGIRFNCIQFLCAAPQLNPFLMAASLQLDGYTILFDDSSISHSENMANMAKVNKATKEA